MKSIDMKKEDFYIKEDEEKGFIRVINPLEDKELENLYKEDYYKSENAIKKRLKDEEWKRSLFLDKYLFFEKYLDITRRDILDIGCGIGTFLELGKERGWNCLGVEPSKQASLCAREKGLNIINEPFDKILFEKNFDVIHLHNVLEHIKNPLEMIDKIKNILKDDGVFSISVPNDFSPFQNILWKSKGFEPWWLVPNHHINYFNFESLSRLLEKNGFKILLKETSFPMELFLLMGENYINNPNIGSEVHSMRVNFDMNLSKYDNDLKRKFYQALASVGVGRDVILYATKI